MCKRNTPQKCKSNKGCFCETPQIKNKASTGCVRVSPDKNDARMGYAGDVQDCFVLSQRLSHG